MYIHSFRDDLELVVEAENDKELIFKTNESLRQIDVWMKMNKLNIAPRKTESVLLKHPRKFSILNFKICNKIITPKKFVKYLGIMIDNGLKFGDHIKY